MLRVRREVEKLDPCNVRFLASRNDPKHLNRALILGQMHLDADEGSSFELAVARDGTADLAQVLNGAREAKQLYLPAGFADDGRGRGKADGNSR